MNNYVGWSASVNNLDDWQCEGIIYEKTQDPLPESEQGMLYAPDVQKGPDGRYYLYYILNNTNVLSVAVCNSPGGKYEFYGHVHYKDGTLFGTGKGEALKFDPGVLVDDDHRVYLYTGFNPPFPFPGNGINVPAKGCEVTELEQDMITVKEYSKVVIPDQKNSGGTGFEGHGFFEAPSIRKYNGKYYLIYSSAKMHELCYAVSEKPTEGFHYGGILISNGDIGYRGRTPDQALNYTGNNHGSTVKIKDKYYIFYHRHTNRNMFNRQGCAEEIQMDESGKFHQAEMTSCGLNGGALTAEGTFEARIACNLMSKNGAVPYQMAELPADIHPYFTQEGEDRENSPDQYIANMRDGSVAGYKYFDFQSVKGITVETRGRGRGTFLIAVDSPENIIGKSDITFSEHWADFEIVCDFPDHIHSLYLSYRGSGTYDLNRFSFLLG